MILTEKIKKYIRIYAFWSSDWRDILEKIFIFQAWIVVIRIVAATDDHSSQSLPSTSNVVKYTMHSKNHAHKSFTVSELFSK